MGRNWEEIIDGYESYDLESLQEKSIDLLEKLTDYFTGWLPREKACFLGLMCVVYFTNADDFLDGDESCLIGYLTNYSTYKYPMQVFNEYRRSDLEYQIEEIMSEAPRSIVETFIALGCVTCAADGFIKAAEHKLIKHWINKI